MKNSRFLTKNEHKLFKKLNEGNQTFINSCKVKVLIFLFSKNEKNEISNTNNLII